MTLNYWLSTHFLCYVWMCRVPAKVFRCFTANTQLVGTFTVLPDRIVCNKWVKGCKGDPHLLICQLIITTPLDPLTQLLICQWLHCSSSTDPSTLLLEVGGQVVLGQHLTLLLSKPSLVGMVCECAVSSTQLFLWVSCLWKYTFVRS